MGEAWEGCGGMGRMDGGRGIVRVEVENVEKKVTFVRLFTE